MSGLSDNAHIKIAKYMFIFVQYIATPKSQNAHNVTIWPDGRMQHYKCMYRDLFTHANPV